MLTLNTDCVNIYRIQLRSLLSIQTKSMSQSCTKWRALVYDTDTHTMHYMLLNMVSVLTDDHNASRRHNHKTHQGCVQSNKSGTLPAKRDVSCATSAHRFATSMTLLARQTVADYHDTSHVHTNLPSRRMFDLKHLAKRHAWH